MKNLKQLSYQLNNDENSYISLLPIEIINNVLFQHFYGYHILSKNPKILKKELDSIFNNNGIILIVSKDRIIIFGHSYYDKLSKHQFIYCARRLYITFEGIIHVRMYNRDLICNINIDIDIYEMNYIKND